MTIEQLRSKILAKEAMISDLKMGIDACEDEIAEISCPFEAGQLIVLPNGRSDGKPMPRGPDWPGEIKRVAYLRKEPWWVLWVEFRGLVMQVAEKEGPELFTGKEREENSD